MDQVKIIEPTKTLTERRSGIEVEERKRVAAYCRVSTDKEEQIVSLKTQKEHYQKIINDHPDWNLIEIYYDEGITGTSVAKRDGFLRMIQDCENNKIDLVITKSISRFGRNTKDTLEYVRHLRDLNIPIEFENEKINTLEQTGEFLLTVLAAIAQQEVSNISSNVNASLKHKMSSGVLVGLHRCLGYDYNVETKEMTVNEYEADIVKYIFRRYIEGAGSKVIARELTEKGIKTQKGNTVWGESSIRGIIRNETYYGKLVQGKTFTVDPISKKRIQNRGEANLYEIENHHEPIISKEEYDKANEILNSRRAVSKGFEDGTKYSRKYSFSSKLECGFCGKQLIRRSWNTGSKNKENVWHCANYIKKGKNYCPNCKAIKEQMLENAFVEAFNALTINNNKSDLLNNFFIETEKALENTDYKRKLYNLEKSINKLKNDDKRLIQLKIDGLIDDESFKEKEKDIRLKINKLQSSYNEYVNINKNQKDIKLRINEFKSKINKTDQFDFFDKDVFEALVDKVIVGGYDENGNEDPYKIVFVLKTGNKCSSDTLNVELENSQGTDNTRRMRGGNAKKVEHQNIVEVLYFRHYCKHYEFSIDENGYRQKVMKRYINVSVCINLE